MGDRFRLLVTFDIKGAKPGDRRYGRADKYLLSLGTVTKVFKQVRLLTTSSEPREIAPELAKIVGPKSGVLVVHAAKPYRFVVGEEHDLAADRTKVSRWLGKAK